MFHPLRGLYDTYHTFGLPERAEPTVARGRRPGARSSTDRRCAASSTAASSCGTARCGPPVPTTPSCPCRRRWPAGSCTGSTGSPSTPPAVRRHLALSAHHRGPPRLLPAGHRPDRGPRARPTCPARTGSGVRRHLFTASRLDGPKRLDLLDRRHGPRAPGDPAAHRRHRARAEELRLRAGTDPRVQFLGFVPDDDLAGLYANALAVPFVPADEDYGLITVEAMACGTPVVTCTDSGGPDRAASRTASTASSRSRPRPRSAPRSPRSSPSPTGPAGWARAARYRAAASPGPRRWPPSSTRRRPAGPAGAGDRPDRRTSRSSARPTAVPARATRPKVVVLTTFEIAQAAPRRPAPLLPPLRQPGPPPRRRGGQPGRARPPGRHPHARARASGSTRSPGATRTTRSAGARRSARGHAGHRHRRRHRHRPLPRLPRRAAGGAATTPRRAPGRALPAARARGGRGRRARGSTTRSTSRPTSRPAPSPAAISAGSSSPR